ncbi:hypothetical protein RSOL_322010 [Rhizoctonia solani AG-3 Rhs1AP]|uniref:Transmembrane protein n=2 Tax=Rhizoctonia solani AG-3 TaxID=1086053 RepID=A0A074SEN3_9AGAM|nr:hypothetical protein RSOL_322010 [Rhizoctonia solani AG-3 Rhs1AP]KEP55248.1 hypothetical protein V565_007550 [Rhizoctonia solani 123E]
MVAGIVLLIADSYAIASMLASASTVVTQWGSFLNGANFSTIRAFVAFRDEISPLSYVYSRSRFRQYSLFASSLFARLRCTSPRACIYHSLCLGTSPPQGASWLTSLYLRTVEDKVIFLHI